MLSLNYMLLALAQSDSMITLNVQKLFTWQHRKHLPIRIQQQKHKKWRKMFKVNNKTPERRHFGVFIVNFEYISHFFLVLLLLTLSMYLFSGDVLLSKLAKLRIKTVVKFIWLTAWLIIFDSSIIFVKNYEQILGVCVTEWY